jgi:hypothetical protein
MYPDEQRAAFRRSEELIAQIRPPWLAVNRKLCAGCSKVIHRERRHCGRRWCPLVHQTWLRDREAVIRRALQTHGGPFLVIAITQTHKPGWWECETDRVIQESFARASAVARSGPRSLSRRTRSSPSGGAHCSITPVRGHCERCSARDMRSTPRLASSFRRSSLNRVVSITGIWCSAMRARSRRRSLASSSMRSLASRPSTTSVSLTATAMRSGGNANTRGLVRLSGQRATCRGT